MSLTVCMAANVGCEEAEINAVGRDQSWKFETSIYADGNKKVF